MPLALLCPSTEENKAEAGGACAQGARGGPADLGWPQMGAQTGGTVLGSMAAEQQPAWTQDTALNMLRASS